MGKHFAHPSVCDVVLALDSIYGKDGPLDSPSKLSYLHTKAKDEDSKLWLVGHVAHMVEKTTFHAKRTVWSRHDWQHSLATRASMIWLSFIVRYMRHSPQLYQPWTRRRKDMLKSAAPMMGFTVCTVVEYPTNRVTWALSTAFHRVAV